MLDSEPVEEQQQMPAENVEQAIVSRDCMKSKIIYLIQSLLKHCGHGSLKNNIHFLSEEYVCVSYISLVIIMILYNWCMCGLRKKTDFKIFCHIGNHLGI